MHQNEMLSREVKVDKLVAHLIDSRTKLSAAETWGTNEWRVAASKAGCLMPSPTTINAVLKRFREIERAKAVAC